jgi:hypothetical protein
MKELGGPWQSLVFVHDKEAHFSGGSLSYWNYPLCGLKIQGLTGKIQRVGEPSHFLPVLVAKPSV